MHITGPGKRLRIYIGESDRWQGKALYMALLTTLKHEGMAGATVTRGVAGFGAQSRIRTVTIERLSEDLPLIVEVVDTPEQIDKALGIVAPMVREGLITIEDVEVAKYSHRFLQPLPGDRPVREVMTHDIVSVTPDTPVADVMDLLIGGAFKSVPVVDPDRRVLGFVSDSDLIKRGTASQHISVAERLDSDTVRAELVRIRNTGLTARDVMTSPAVTIGENMSLAHATALMVDSGRRRLPVVDADHRLVGFLSRVDVLRTVASAKLPHHERTVPAGAARTVADLMDRDVPTVAADATLADIVDKMVAYDLRRVIVVDGDGVVAGIINDGDLVARVRSEAHPSLLDSLLHRRRQGDLPDVSAAELMTPSVLTGPPDTSVTVAIQRMLDERRKRFVVVDGTGRPIGIVDRQSLLHAVIGMVAQPTSAPS
jgi:CBS-domain-containing membrane protein